MTSVVFERGSLVPSAKMLTFYRTEPFSIKVFCTAAVPTAHMVPLPRPGILIAKVAGTKGTGGAWPGHLLRQRRLSTRCQLNLPHPRLLPMQAEYTPDSELPPTADRSIGARACRRDACGVLQSEAPPAARLHRRQHELRTEPAVCPAAPVLCQLPLCSASSVPAGSFDIGPFTVPAGADKAKLKVGLGVLHKPACTQGLPLPAAASLVRQR